MFTKTAMHTGVCVCAWRKSVATLCINRHSAVSRARGNCATARQLMRLRHHEIETFILAVIETSPTTMNEEKNLVRKSCKESRGWFTTTALCDTLDVRALVYFFTEPLNAEQLIRLVALIFTKQPRINPTRPLKSAVYIVSTRLSQKSRKASVNPSAYISFARSTNPANLKVNKDGSHTWSVVANSLSPQRTGKATKENR